MKISKFVLLATTLFGFAAYPSYGQGCSDAGFCTLNSFKPNKTDSTDVLNDQFKVGVFLGKADNSISVYGNYLEYNRQLNEKFGLDAKLITLAQNGNGISTFGLSDLFVNSNYKAAEKVVLTAGAKIPLSNAGKTYDNLPLPMDYQASLGTVDFIFGVGVEIRRIQLVAAVQQPLTRNGNQFIAADYPENSKLRTFRSTKKFQRSGDVLLRVSYPVNLNSEFKLTPGILPVYHLSNDRFTDEFNVKNEIKGSKGLTLNGNIYLDYEINHNNLVQLNVAMPLMVRDARPDGLTRSIIANLEYRIRF